MKVSGRLESYNPDSGEFRVTGLVSPVAMDIPSSDIAGVTIEVENGSSVFVRSGRSWSRDTEAVDALLTLLCTEEADGVQIAESVASVGSSISLRFERFGGLPAAEFAVELNPEALTISRETVSLVYLRTRDRADQIAAWLGSMEHPNN